MKSFMRIAIPLALALLGGCQSESWRGSGERYIHDQMVEGQTSPTIVGRTYVAPSAIDEIIQKLGSRSSVNLGVDRVYDLNYGGFGPFEYSRTVYVYIRPWNSGSEIRVWAFDEPPRFDLKPSADKWSDIRNALDQLPAQSWLIYPTDPTGEYASKKFGAPKPGSPDLSMN